RHLHGPADPGRRGGGRPAVSHFHGARGARASPWRMGRKAAARMSLDVLLKHKFPNFAVDVAFSTPTPEVVALFGPSGCGKSTVMMAVAGLLDADEVRIVLDGKVLSDLPPAERRIGVVFQDGRLFPHLSVAANLRYGLHRAPSGPLE